MHKRSSGLRSAICLTGIVAFTMNAFAQPGGNKKTQPVLGTRSARIIDQDGLRFKDLNANNKVDPYEDWRLTPVQRSADLLKQMTVEEKAGMMLIADMRMSNERSMLDRGAGEQRPITTEFSEQDIVVNRNLFTGDSLPYPIMNAVGTTNGIVRNKLRHFIWRTTAAPADSMAKWSNKVQALAESDRLGIPVIFASNPRNHITGGGIGATGAATKGFSKWPIPRV
ncbi:MAG: hypothetical protein EOP49_53175 [Sphingobacteriales bacterium]|nr:MAG: hypothetical protein EOP49_53175 [Sphingobacteriales bacterium]